MIIFYFNAGVVTYRKRIWISICVFVSLVLFFLYVLFFNSSQAHGQKTCGTACAMTNGLTSHMVNCNCVILSTNIYSQHVTAR